MAGHVIATYLTEKKYQVTVLSGRTAWDKKTVLLDVREKSDLEEFLEKRNYNLVINAIAILGQQSEREKGKAVYLNSYLPHWLASFYKGRETKVIHLSTDGVFSGEHPPYDEESEYDGTTFYARSKALGEIKNYKDLTLRTSIVGPDRNEFGIGLFNWWATSRGEIEGYTKTIWTGVTTIELAKAIVAADKQNLVGLYHLVPAESISKYDLLALWTRVFVRNDLVMKKNAKKMVTNRTLINTRADFNFRVADYRTMTEEMRGWIKEHASFYPHYRFFRQR
jgi:dTDP-4-dehydrorhamnose reductase